MTSLRFSVSLLALTVISACNFDLDSIPSVEDCENAGLTNCGSSSGGSNGGSAGNNGGTGGSAGNNGGSGGSSGSGGVGGTGGISGSGGVGGTGGIGGIGGIGGGGGFGGTGGSVTDCGGDSCDPLPSNPFVQLESCCFMGVTCGAEDPNAQRCIDALHPGVSDAACPNDSGAPLSGCCRTDGRCGFDGTILSLGCIAREDMPFSLGGPRPMIACGTIVRQPCLATSDCGSGHVCGNIDFTTGESYCVPSNPDGQQTGEQCWEPMSSGECESGLCFANTLECSSSCRTSGDCINSEGEPACAGFLAGSGARFNICGTNCRGQAWCRADQVCGIALDANTDQTIGMCAALNAPGVRLSASGEPCGDDTECASSLCLQNPSFGQSLCSSVCEGPADCSTGFPLPRQCVPINQLGIGLFGNISVCQ